MKMKREEELSSTHTHSAIICLSFTLPEAKKRADKAFHLGSEESKWLFKSVDCLVFVDEACVSHELYTCAIHTR